MKPTFTREVNGNHAVRIGEELRDLEGVKPGDYVTVEVKAVHRHHAVSGSDE